MLAESLKRELKENILKEDGTLLFNNYYDYIEKIGIYNLYLVGDQDKYNYFTFDGQMVSEKWI